MSHFHCQNKKTKQRVKGSRESKRAGLLFTVRFISYCLVCTGARVSSPWLTPTVPRAVCPEERRLRRSLRSSRSPLPDPDRIQTRRRRLLRSESWFLGRTIVYNASEMALGMNPPTIFQSWFVVQSVLRHSLKLVLGTIHPPTYS
ncbi:Uncharacterized protein DAT39_011382 [Clarias magur]|uniref:Uncharacterized protein n=1 Tax=Clarias magur TaxID=1594786 RepID=A0A8J4XDK9_CLAMG|nr:Uncharacterized protein DAT39_011382 [Clarias magur]